MLDAPKKKAPKERAPTGVPVPVGSAAASQGITTLADHEILYHAVEGFIRGNNNFESSVAINTAIDDIGKCVDVQTAFAIPLQHKLFSMDAALRWVLFFSQAPSRAVQEGDAPFSNASDFTSMLAFALGLIAAVYDVGVQESVWDHFEPDEEDEEEDEEDEKQ